MSLTNVHLGRRMMGAVLGTAALLGGSMVVMAVRAQETNAPAERKAPPPPSGKITPWAAMKIATDKVAGRALNANFEYDEGHWVYGVMVLTNDTPKQIKEVELNPTTGKVGDVEEVTPDGEAKEVASELRAALNSAGGAAQDEKNEKD